jgi:DNA topoisomerase-1
MPKKNLVLVESPAKAKTIQKFVDSSTVVRATYGHVRDLPRTNLGVDVKDNFTPKYVIPKKASPIVKELKSLAKSAETVYLATDPDREGEAIAWHLASALELKPDKTRRILFHEITNQAIQNALKHPGEINAALVDAQQARRVLDRLVGYSLSPLLWQKIYRGLSAGRVQSVALRLITDREEEIGKFKTTEYWSLWATFLTDKKESFLAKLEKVSEKSLPKYPTKAVIEKAKSYASDDWLVTDRITEQKQRHPKPPFTTSTLQQEASRKLHFSVKQTMMHAQKLYEGIAVGGETIGLITYMRTDSLNVAELAISEAREVIQDTYGQKYLPSQPKIYKTKSKGAQEAHEAVRPTSFKRKPDDIKQYLAPQEFKLYKLIWERALACQMSSADTEATQLHIGPKKEPTALTYIARGLRIIFPGYLKVYEEGVDDPTELDQENSEMSQFLPLIKKDDSVDLKDTEEKQHFTQPPPRFTEASLVKELERLGIGRPSTYSPTISTIIDRGYVAKEENKFVPKDVGKIVIELLKEKFPSIVDYTFTAKMEDELDEIADGDKKWQAVIKEFYGPFHKLVEAAGKDLGDKKLSEEATDEKCPVCGKPMVIKLGRYGKFYACTGFPECKHTRPLEMDEKTEENLVEGRKCPKDGGDLVIKRGRFGSFIGCSNYPNCNYMESIKKEIGVPCPKDGGAIVELRSRRGKVFWGCENYPKCDFASWDKPVAEPCPKCKGLMVIKKGEIVCTNGDFSKPLPDASVESEAVSKPTKSKKQKVKR